MNSKETIAVWFSCGAASAVAAKKTIERYKGTHFIRVLNNPVVEEHLDNIRFLRDIEQWLGLPIERDPNAFKAVCEKRSTCSPYGAEFKFSFPDGWCGEYEGK